MFAVLLSFAASLATPLEEKSFLSWMRNTNQFYTGDEYHFRLGLYLANSRKIAEFNSGKHSFRIGHNKFSCMTPSEYASLLTRGQSTTSSRSQIFKTFNVKADEIVDWREKGIVNAVKDQGQCGSCWAFGTIQACESAYALSTGKLLSCSEQNLVDCCTSCYGCSGGMESTALDFILNKQSGLLNSETDYPYKAVQQSCTFDETKGINQITGYVHGKAGDEDYLKQLSSQGVCDIAIYASLFSFQAYTSGIYADNQCSSVFLNHAVGLVGYGSENGSDYWIVRNSWGASWGEDGYIRIARNANNMCGVATDALQVNA